MPKAVLTTKVDPSYDDLPERGHLAAIRRAMIGASEGPATFEGTPSEQFGGGGDYADDGF